MVSTVIRNILMNMQTYINAHNCPVVSTQCCFCCHHQTTEWLSYFLSRDVFLRICCGHWKPLLCMARSSKILDFLFKFGFGKDKKKVGRHQTQYSLPGHIPWPNLCQLFLWYLLATPQQADNIWAFWETLSSFLFSTNQWFGFSLPSLDDTLKTREV